MMSVSEKVSNESSGKGASYARLNVMLLVILYVTVGVSLYLGEFLTFVYSYKSLSSGMDFGNALGHIFRPRLLVSYFAGTALVFGIVRFIINPLFTYLKTGKGFDKACKSISRVPWAILFSQILAWVIATLAYSAFTNWKTESGTPLEWVLFMKVALGSVSAMYGALLLNIVLKPYKTRMQVFSIGNGMKDIFSRFKNIFIVISLVFSTLCIMGYLAFFYASSRMPMNNIAFLPAFITILAIMLGISIGLMLLSRSEHESQVNFLLSRLNEFSTGNADLTKNIILDNFNVVGELTQSFNVYINKLHDDIVRLKQIIQNVKNYSMTVAGTSTELATNTEEQSAHVEEVSASMADFVDQLRKIEESIFGQSAITNQNNSTALKVSSGLMSISKSTQSLSAQTVEDYKFANNGIESVNELMERTQGINDTIVNIAKNLKSTGEYTGKVDEILLSIKDISDQTNVLSMNAAIEASHAGKYGKGFAIVADEIRKLSMSTKDSTAQVARIMGQIKESVEQSSKIAMDSADQAKVHNDLIQHSRGILEAIAQNLSNTVEIVEGIDERSAEYSGLIQEFITSTQKLDEYSQHVQAIVDDSIGNAYQIKESMLHIGKSYEENAQNAVKLSGLSEKLQNMGSHLTAVSGQFKTKELTAIETESV